MSSTEALFARYGSAYRGLATITAMVSAIAVVLSSTIVNVAVPAIMGQFGIDQTRVQWLSTGFLAAMTVSMLMTAWCERAFGQRMTMVGALGLFLAGSILGGIAPDENVLIVSRVIQGLAAGVVQPLAMVVMFQIFPPEKRGAAMGLFGIGVVLAPALGPWVGGVLMDSFNWRFLFYLGIPFGVGGMLLAQLFLPGRTPAAAKAPLDWQGVIWLAVALLALLEALSSGQRSGWASLPVLGMFAVCIVATTGFLWRQARAPEPLLDLKIFKSLPFTAAMLVSFVLGAGLFGSTYLLPVFVQQLQNYTPTQAGLLLMPAGFVLVVIFPLAGALSDRIPAGLMIGFGLIVFAWSAFLTSHVSANTSFWTLAGWTAISRIGLGAVFPSLSAASLRVLPPPLLAQASGAMNFIRQLGGALGTSLLTVFLERRTVFHGEALAATQTPDNPATTAYLGETARVMQQLGVAPADQGAAAGWLLGQTVYYQATAAAFRDGFLVVGVVFLAALLPTWLLHRAQRQDPSAAPPTAIEAEADVEAGSALGPALDGAR
jgi:MFS transporter, DHA2 family, multidrug resistance protein